jgi:methionine sulfoxide reductase heme-binding subunit
MKPLISSHPLLWLVLAAPGAYWLWAYATEAMSYGEVIHASGDLSVQLLIVTLAITPLRLLWTGAGAAAWLARRRRDLGVAVFGYAALHLGVYLVRKADPALILSEAAEAGLLTGWIAFAMFLPLAITSNDQSVRWLKRNWKRLHRLVYLGAALSLAHWILTAFDPLNAYIHTGILVAIEALRLVLQAQRRRAKVVS